MPLYGQDEKGALVPVKGDIPEEALIAIERADEQSIVERLTSVDAQQTFGYAYPIKTKEGDKWVIGIGVDGAKEIAHELGNIRVSTELRVDERGDHLYGVLPVTDLVRNVTLLGAARQSKYIVGEGMVPTDRIDDLAWVKLVNKCQRNGILAVADQLMIANIVSRLDPKAIRRLPSPPTYGKQALTKTATTKVSTEEEVLKKLRQQVAIEAKKVFKEDEERKAWQKEQYGVDSMTELNQEQLKDMLAKIIELQQPSKKPLFGFSSEAEQKQSRKELFSLLTQAGYTTDEQKRQFLSEKKPREEITHTSQLAKDEMEKMKEVLREEIKLVEEASSIDEAI